VRGYVYILVNEHMPGLIKIGRTARCPYKRAEELWHTGVPSPFNVFHHVLSPDCVELEAMVHRCLPDKRVSEGREFFEYGPNDAITLLDDLHRTQVEDWLSDFLPDQVITHEMDFIDPCFVALLADQTGRHVAEVIAALQEIRAEEIRGALARWDAKVALRKKNKDWEWAE